MNNTKWIHQLFDTFSDDTEVELCFEEKEKLTSENPVLNCSVHPIRFGDDIFFNFQTNNNDLKAKLKKYEVNYAMFYHYADTIKAGYLNSVKKNSIKANSCLLIGQTEKDKVIFDGEKHLSLLDYLPKLKQLSQQYETLYFKPHPYAKNSKYIYKMLKKELKNVELIYENVYHFLSNEHITQVVALNSSVLYEAKYFRKDVTFLYKPTFDFEMEDIGIYGDYFTSSFWSDILDVKDKGVTLPFVPNRLRKSLNDFWGYNEISDELILKDIIKSKIKYFLSKYVR